MSVSDFSNKDHFPKVILVECYLVYLISAIPGSWTADGNAYYKSFSDVEFITIEESGTELTKKNSVADCKANSGSWYQDFTNERIYIHTINSEIPDNDSPENHYYTGTFWTGFTNNQQIENRVIFSPQTASKPIYYRPYLDSRSLRPLTQSLGDYYTTSIKSDLGGVSFIGAGWFYENRTKFIWHNRTIVIKLGYVGAAYGSYEVIYTGIIRDPQYADNNFKISIDNRREKELGKIPIDRYATATHPLISDQLDGKPVQIVFGQKENVTCIKVNESGGYNYLVSDTVFNGTTYALDDISAVYVDGIRVYVTTNYTVDLNRGIITLLDDPGDSIITADVKGIQCQFDFTESGGGAKTDTWTENVADILFFIIKELNQVALADIDTDSFNDLQGKRTQKIGLVLDRLIETKEIIRTLQQSSQFHLFANVEGTYIVKHYDRTESSVTKYFWPKNFSLSEDTKSCFNKVALNYDRNPTTDEWKVVESTNVNIKQKYDTENQVLEVDTYLTDTTEAQNAADFYAQLTQEPLEKIKTSDDLSSLDYIPTNKITVEREVVADKKTITVLEETVYQIIQINKDINKGISKLVLLKDTQAQGTGSHADIDYQDSHSDSHLDSHSDVDHQDSYSDTHNDSHTDEPHENSHNDAHLDHEDVIHLDSHADSHTDEAYEDVPHQDTSYDDHSDSHTDSHIDSHGDEHTDEAHVDSEL